MTDDAIQRIRNERGRAMRIAEACGIRRTAVYQWKQVPLERVPEVCIALGMTPLQVRPDYFRRIARLWKK